MNTSDSRHLKGIPLGAALAASLAVLLAAGCGNSTPSTATSAASGTTASTASAAGSARSADGGASPSTAGPGSSSLPPKPTAPGPGGPRDCSTDMLALSIQPLTEPINHVMIAAKNTSQQPCHLIKYPLLHTSQSAKAAIGAAAATKPAGVITLAPGATAYAGLMTSSADGSGKNGANVPKLVLELQSSSPAGGGTGRPVMVTMPGSADYIDSSATVTYWEDNPRSATY